MTTQIKLQNALREYLEHCFPQQKHTRILNLTRISDGWETDVYSFSIQYQRNGKSCKENLILRLYPGDGASGKAAKEFHAMAKLHQIGYPVPKVHHLETDRRQASITARVSRPPNTTSSGCTAWNPMKRWFRRSA